MGIYEQLCEEEEDWLHRDVIEREREEPDWSWDNDPLDEILEQMADLGLY